MNAEQAVAVVGMACRLPGANDVAKYWTALRAGSDGVTRFAPEQLVTMGVDPEIAGLETFVPVMGVLQGARHFDWQLFGYSRAEAASIDPQQRVFLQCAMTALDDAAIDPVRFRGRIGVYAGCDKVHFDADAQLSALASYIGQEKDFLAARVAYKLGLTGPAITLQTACSTSLTAVHLAVQSLRLHECDAALAGGVTVTPTSEWGYLFEPGGIFSPDGYCRPFDQQAFGTVPADGAGVVVLKRLTDAVRDGDRIAATIVGSAVNNDGAEKMGFVAPSVTGQGEVIRLAQKVAGVDPADISYVEAHGTATRLGDPIEVQALSDVFGEVGRGSGWCGLGAVKSNLGHTGAAAGVAGLIKTVLMLEHRELVPTLHYTNPNPLLELDASPFRVVHRNERWPETGVLSAGVSAFGMGGSNSHVVLQSAPRRTSPPSSDRARLLTLSSSAPDALERLRHEVASYLRVRPELSMAAVTHTMGRRRSFPVRQAFVVRDTQHAADQLLIDRSPSRACGGFDQVAFLLPGQGTLHSAAGAAAHRLLPAFRSSFDEINALTRRRHGVDLSPVITEQRDHGDWFTDTMHQQLGLFALGYALGAQLKAWGVRPAALLGNSIGEVTAAALAGTWTVADAIEVVLARATAMQASAPGRMVVVRAAVEEVASRLSGSVECAVTGPAMTVVSGPSDAIGALLAGDALHGLETRLLDVRHAFHSASMEDAAAELAEALATIPARPLEGRLVSNTTGRFAEPAAVRDPQYWAEQLRRPVLLDSALGAALDAGCSTFLELGPGSSMTVSVRQHRQWVPGHLAVPLLGTGDEHAVLSAVGTLWELGAEVVLEEPTLPCSLPGYAFSTTDPVGEPLIKPEVLAHSRPVGSQAHKAHEAINDLWCRALGVSTVSDSDDFFTSGGESLMALDLVTRIRERTGIAVSLTDFTVAPTFGRLLLLADAQPSSEATLVTFRTGGSGRPIFLIADATDTAVSYRALAGKLEGERPVHGLEPRAGVVGRSIEELAAAYVPALRTSLPEKSCIIGGWSFGAVVAHELARQLMAEDIDVDALVLLDGYPSTTADWTHNLLTRVSATLGVGAVGRQLRRSGHPRRPFAANLRSLSRYRPQPASCPATVFLADVDSQSAAQIGRDLNPLYPVGLQVHRVTGDHWSMLAPPHVDDLALRLSNAVGA